MYSQTHPLSQQIYLPSQHPPYGKKCGIAYIIIISILSTHACTGGYRVPNQLPVPNQARMCMGPVLQVSQHRTPQASIIYEHTEHAGKCKM
jgi:hypothetical protein